MEEDQRIKDHNKLIKEKLDKRYLDLFNSNPFRKIDLIITWLSQELKKKIQSAEDAPKILFENYPFPTNLEKALNGGDAFYTALFDTEKWIPESLSDLQVTTPLRNTVRRIYNSIWQIENETRSDSLTVYWEFQNHLEQLLGFKVGKDETLNSVSEWNRIHDAAYRLQNFKFYHSWVSAIDSTTIKNLVNELSTIAPGKKLHELARIMDFRHDKEKHSDAYAAKLLKLAKQSDWEYVREATDKSDQLSLNADIDFNGSLLLTTDIKDWLAWVDNLGWPILQDHAFYNVRKLDVFEDIISLIVSETLGLQTKSEHVLLIALNHYQRFIRDITTNLYFIKGDNWNNHVKEVEKEIRTDAKQQYDHWINTELKASCEKVFNNIFGTLPISESKFFSGVFEWINRYSKEQFVHKPNIEPIFKTIDTLNEVFQQILNADTAHKLTILESVGIEKLNWQTFDKFIGIFENDETEVSYGQALYAKYQTFIESKYFQWNLQLNFDNVYINQACNLSYLLSKCTDPVIEWQQLLNKFKCWHEGWNSTERWAYEPRRKESFVLMVGSCLCYSYYKDGKKIEAEQFFRNVLNVTLSQSRVDVSNNGDDYTIIVRLLAHVVTQFHQSKADEFVTTLYSNIDSEQAFLIIMHELCLGLKKKGQQLNQFSVQFIMDRVQENFWILENKYNDHASMDQLNFYTAVRDELYAILNPSQ